MAIAVLTLVEQLARIGFGADILSENIRQMLAKEMDSDEFVTDITYAYQAALEHKDETCFLSHDTTVSDLLQHRSDVHHVYPKAFLKNLGHSRGKYNQIAYYVLAQSEINIAISNTSPDDYFPYLLTQRNGAQIRYWGKDNEQDIQQNHEKPCIPLCVLDQGPMD